MAGEVLGNSHGEQRKVSRNPLKREDDRDNVSGMSTEEALASLRYPIGRFERPLALTPAERTAAVETLAQLPQQLRTAVAGLSEAQLDTRYRPGGWTFRQLVHHVADSHLNAYARMRLAIGEDWPTIKPYDEAVWAELADARTMPVEVSLALLEALHARWVYLLRTLGEEDWKRGYQHPESGPQSIEQVLALYEWHSRHHLAHIAGIGIGRS